MSSWTASRKSSMVRRQTAAWPPSVCSKHCAARAWSRYVRPRHTAARWLQKAWLRLISRCYPALEVIHLLFRKRRMWTRRHLVARDHGIYSGGVRLDVTVFCQIEAPKHGATELFEDRPD